jgi:hypothetical protein
LVKSERAERKEQSRSCRSQSLIHKAVQSICYSMLWLISGTCCATLGTGSDDSGLFVRL